MNYSKKQLDAVQSNNILFMTVSMSVSCGDIYFFFNLNAQKT